MVNTPLLPKGDLISKRVLVFVCAAFLAGLMVGDLAVRFHASDRYEKQVEGNAATIVQQAAQISDLQQVTSKTNTLAHHTADKIEQLTAK